MMKRFQIGRLIFAMTAATLPILAARGDTLADTALQRAKKEGSIRIGYSNAIPPAYKSADGRVTGEDVEIARSIAKKLGINKVDSILTEWGSIVPGLKAERIDLTMAMYITPKRCEQIAFSDPIYRLGEAMLVPQGNPKSIKDLSTFAENKDLKLAVVTGAVEVDYAKIAGIDQSQLLVLRDNTSLLAAVQSGRADAGALPAIQLIEMAKKVTGIEVTPQYFEVAGKPVEGYGAFGFRKEDRDLLEAFNQELKTFLGSSEHLAIVTPFGFGKNTLPGKKTTAELCAGK
ncbi:ectoine/hydroxyectoine ABC transporter substrate-binding protein EhuB [Bradyrhizobium sp. B097]|uniref:ectoine/hydroxyectoine ABC transporter substrate-binding protein EhuB n=1 Tax=Bradyrhizobium sp. B097 TaxID=3140244 RepID=UPI0031832A75